MCRSLTRYSLGKRQDLAETSAVEKQSRGPLGEGAPPTMSPRTLPRALAHLPAQSLVRELQRLRPQLPPPTSVGLRGAKVPWWTEGAGGESHSAKKERPKRHVRATLV